MKNIFKILSVGLGLLLVVATSSCSSSKHSYRISQIPEKNVVIADKIGVELRIDENKIIQASTSRSHKSVEDAKDEAYYNAITNNNIHVLIDPIYKTITGPKILMFGGKSTSTVTGFAGYYENPKSYKEFKDDLDAEKLKKDQDAFDLAIKQMKQLKEDGLIKPTITSNVSSDRITIADKISNLESLELTTLNVEVEYELTKTTEVSSLVDEYKDYLKGLDNPASVGNNSNDKEKEANPMFTEEKETKKVGIVGKILGKVKAILKKIPFLGKLIK